MGEMQSKLARAAATLRLREHARHSRRAEPGAAARDDARHASPAPHATEECEIELAGCREGWELEFYDVKMKSEQGRRAAGQSTSRLRLWGDCQLGASPPLLVVFGHWTQGPAAAAVPMADVTLAQRLASAGWQQHPLHPRAWSHPRAASRRAGFGKAMLPGAVAHAGGCPVLHRLSWRTYLRARNANRKNTAATGAGRQE